MKDPGTLPPVLEHLVAAETSELPPPAGVREQILDRLVATHGEAALASIGAHAGGATATAAVVKLAIVVAVAGASFGVGYWTGFERREVVMVPPRKPVVAVNAAEPSPPPSPSPSPVPVPAAAPAPIAPPDAGVAPTAPRAVPTAPRAVPTARPVELDAAVEPETPALQRGRENRLLRTAWEALEAQDFDLALRTLETHASEFPDGLMAEEREALWVRVLVDAGNYDGARLRAAEFRRRYPDSIHLRTVDRVLAQIPKQEPRPADKE